MDVQGTEMIEKLRRSFRKSQETAPFFTGWHTCAKLRAVLRDCAGHPDVPGHILEYFYKLHTRVVLYLSYVVVVRGFFDHSAQTDGRKIRRERAAAHENTYKITYYISDDHGSTDLFDLYLDFRTQFLSEPGVPGDLRRWPGGSLCRRVDPGIQPPD